LPLAGGLCFHSADDLPPAAAALQLARLQSAHKALVARRTMAERAAI
jgi:hypothetical protein